MPLFVSYCWKMTYHQNLRHPVLDHECVGNCHWTTRVAPESRPNRSACSLPTYGRIFKALAWSCMPMCVYFIVMFASPSCERAMQLLLVSLRRFACSGGLCE